MYHDRTKGRRDRRRMVALVLAGVVAVAAAVLLAGAALRQQTLAQGSASVRDAVLRAASQCCAVEGSYPSNIEYLEDHYGLAVNRDDYAIIYEAFASNVAPSVVVTPR